MLCPRSFNRLVVLGSNSTPPSSVSRCHLCTSDASFWRIFDRTFLVPLAPPSASRSSSSSPSRLLV
jgi:hypothetical protein